MNAFAPRTPAAPPAVIAAVLAIALTGPGPGLAAENALVHGAPHSEWTARWWQWQEVHYPAFDFGEGLVDCARGQDGPVFFLAGTGGGAAERECIAPIAGHKHLMMPLVNAIFFNDDEICPGGVCTVQDKRVILDGLLSSAPPGIFNSTACLLHAELDGAAAVFEAPIVRAQSPPFDYAGDPEAVADGFWVVLSPLPPGAHVIRFTGGLCDVDSGQALFDVDVTYRITAH